jgi:hypothetical protein
MHRDPTSIRMSAARGYRAELALLLLAGGAVYGWIAAYDTSTMAFQDSIEYLRLADFYRHFLFGAPLVESAEYYRSTRLPPLFPLLLALLGAGTEHQHAAAMVTAATAVAAALAVWAWRRLERPGDREALGIALALLLYPGFFLLNLDPVSEPLAIAMLYGALALLAPPRPTHSRLLAAGLAIGLAPLARTALLPLPIAFALWLMIERPLPKRQLLLPLACACIPIMAWMAYRGAVGSDSYLAQLGEARLVERLGPWPDALWLQPRRLLDGWIGNWGIAPTPAITGASLLIGLLALAGSLLRLRRNRLDAWFLGGYVLLILVWPFPFELPRFLVVVYPLILVCALEGLRAAVSRWRGHRLLPGAILATAVVVASMPAWTRFVSRAALPVDPALLGDKREPPFFRIRDDERALVALEVFARMRFLSEAAGEHVPDAGCVYSVHPEMQQLYGRIHAVRYPLDLAGASAEDASKRLDQCEWFILSGFDTAEPALPALYPWPALKGWTVPVLSSVFRHGNAEVPAGILLRRATPPPEEGENR